MNFLKKLIYIFAFILAVFAFIDFSVSITALSRLLDQGEGRLVSSTSPLVFLTGFVGLFLTIGGIGGLLSKKWGRTIAISSSIVYAVILFTQNNMTYAILSGTFAILAYVLDKK